MDSEHYLALAMDAFAKLEKLQQERESIEAEAMKLEQLIAATANMLPDDTREKVMLRLTTLRELFRLRDVGLTDAIRTILRKAAGDCLTATNVRDRLISFGFDFTDYSTNPLASISTTLRRMKPEEVETTTVDGGVAAYRWVSKSLAVRVAESQASRNQGFWAAQEVLAGWKKTGLEPPPKLDAALKKK